MLNVTNFFDTKNVEDAHQMNEILREAFFYVAGQHNHITHQPRPGDVLIARTGDMYQCIDQLCNVTGMYAFIPLGCPQDDNIPLFYSHMGANQRMHYFAPGAVKRVVRERYQADDIGNAFIESVHKLSLDANGIKAVSALLPKPIPQVIT